MKTMTLAEASRLVENKKGAGKAKKTKIKLEIEFTGGVTKTATFLAMLDAMLKAHQIGTGIGWPIRDWKIKEAVTTELESNPER